MSRGYLDDLEGGADSRGLEGEAARAAREQIAAALAAYAQNAQQPEGQP